MPSPRDPNKELVNKTKQLNLYNSLLTKTISILNEHQKNLENCKVTLSSILKNKRSAVPINQFVKYRKLIRFSKDGINDSNIKIAQYQKALVKINKEIDSIKKIIETEEDKNQCLGIVMQIKRAL